MGKGRGKGKRKEEDRDKKIRKRKRGIRRRHFDLCSGPKRAIPALCNNEKKN